MLRIRAIFVFFFISVFLLIGNDVLSIFYTKKMMQDNMKEQVNHEAVQLSDYIETARQGESFVEDVIGTRLRDASIAALKLLDPDIDKVTNDQLREVAKQVNVDEITLLRRTKDDIILEKSSDPKEIGISAKPWGFWYTAFEQLFQDRQVTIQEGQKLDHFWAGAFEYATSKPEDLDKFGYYYDGSTNYIINPYFHDTLFNQYRELTGVDAIIKTTLSNQTYLGIAVFNPDTFGKDPRLFQQEQNNILLTPYPDRQIYFGEYSYQLDTDAENVRRAAAGMTQRDVETVYNGKPIMKSFVPIQVQDRTLVVGIVADEHELFGSIQHQIFIHTIIVVTAFFISLFCMAWTTRYIRKLNDNAVKVTQLVYVDEVNHMFTTIRGQRHDFLNHVQTIHALAAMNKWENIKAYTAELVGESMEANDLIQIGHPVIAAVIQSKVISAIEKKITFLHDFAKCSGLQYGVKSLDIVKIIGNLIDNAFDEVLQLPPEERRVEIEGSTNHGILELRVTNPTKAPLSKEDEEKMFSPGYSTKDKGGHSGIGLPIIKNSVERYKGSIRTEYSDRLLSFLVTIPLE